jgi:hypothetical protein
VPGDVRITTRYDAADFGRALMGVLHETGHALYEQGRPQADVEPAAGEVEAHRLHELEAEVALDRDVERAGPPPTTCGSPPATTPPISAAP